MPETLRSNRRKPALIVLVALAGAGWTTLSTQAASTPDAELAASFESVAKPFLDANCVACHNVDAAVAGVRVDLLDGKLEDRRIPVWQRIRHKVGDGSMPPEGMPQPTDDQRKQMLEWITNAIEIARSRPRPKNGLVRRLTKAQYRNTLQELLKLDDDLTDILPPDAVSKDGFVNNTATLETSPLLMEAYFEIAEEALERAIVNPDEKPSIQSFRVGLGAKINPAPLDEELILGANSMLLDIDDYVVEELTPTKPFAFEKRRMRTKYRFIEGYKGNATVRGWRDFDSIYHAVFADMRGSRGYPKGRPYDTVPEGLLLRPAIPTDELFGSDGTYGPKANFKISLRELPDHGRFRVTVKAAKYDDGLLLDEGDAPQPEGAPGAVVWNSPAQAGTLEIPKAGIYQIDVYDASQRNLPAPDASRLGEGLAGAWDFENGLPGKAEADAKPTDSPFGKAVALDGRDDAIVIPKDDSLEVGTGDFTVSAWIHPKQLRPEAIVVSGGYDQMPGWRLGILNKKGVLAISTTKGDDDSNGEVRSPAGVVRADAWQHVAAVVRRGEDAARLYVNGYPVAKGTIGPANLDSPKGGFLLGRVTYELHFRGDLDEVRLYGRALEESEIQALVEPGRSFALPPPEGPEEGTITLGGRPFSSMLQQPAFAAVRLPAGPLEVSATRSGIRKVERVVLTPLGNDHPVAQRLRRFEARAPKLGVQVGLRRDCGSTFAPVGEPQEVADGDLESYVFEGAIQDYPSPDVEKDNVNYLAGIREIAVRSEYTDGRDMPRLLVRSVEFEGPLYETWPPRSHRNIFIDFDRKHDSKAYARAILRNFASRAYRRPATAAELSALMAVFEQSLEAGGGFQDSVKDALLVVLNSPQFLFLTESSETPQPEPLDDYELASKLSYFLWNGPPDEKTLKLAADGKLRDELDAEVDRMVADAQFARFAKQFTAQWLNLDKFDVLEPDREQFPKLTRAARTQLRKEPIELVRYLIQKNLPVRKLIDADFVMANEVTASYYDLGDKTESGFRFTPIVNGRPELGSVLTEAALMAGLSDGRESNPVKRGAWLARKIIAEPPPDPPPNVPDLSADTEGLTLRQRLEQHRSQPACMQCHKRIDPWGVALEELDAGGRLKTEPADAHSTLPDGAEVGGVDDLRRHLAEDRIDQVAFSVLKHLSIYANGRSLTYQEASSLKQDALKLRASDYRMRDMIRYVVHSDMFLEK